MVCLKCGRETRDKNVFCRECLQTMERCPVKPDTPVVLPQRKKVERKTGPRKLIKPEETIARLRATIRRLWVALALLTVLLAASVGTLSFLLYQSYSTPAIGSNYNTVSPETGVGR